MFGLNKENELLSYIRQGKAMTRAEKLRLIVEMSIPSMLAQLSAVLMFFIDASMVGQLGARQSASVGLVETSTWLFGGLTSAASMGFSVQVAHCIGANDFERARRVLRQGLVCTFLFSSILTLIAVAIHSDLPYWLGGGSDIAHDASMYFLIFALAGPFFQMESLAGSDMAHWLKLSAAKRTNIIDSLGCTAPELEPTPEQRQERYDNWQLTDDHGMLIYGIAKDQNGKEYYMVKNSWGEAGEYKGIWYMTKNYIVANTMDYMVNVNAIPKDILKKMEDAAKKKGIGD